jgi:hypothetical protein
MCGPAISIHHALHPFVTTWAGAGRSLIDGWDTPWDRQHDEAAASVSKRKIDADEKALLESVEREGWKSAGGGKRERTRYSRYA